jgi:hypothetical protein
MQSATKQADHVAKRAFADARPGSGRSLKDSADLDRPNRCVEAAWFKAPIEALDGGYDLAALDQRKLDVALKLFDHAAVGYFPSF